MTPQDVALERQIESARTAAAQASVLAKTTVEDLYSSSDATTSAHALTAIALSLSAIASVLVATLDEEVRR